MAGGQHGEGRLKAVGSCSMFPTGEFFSWSALFS